jgi:hypothetical protein
MTSKYPMVRRRHLWITAPIAEGTRLAMSFNQQRLATIWAPGSWKPERVLDILATHFTLSAILQTADQEAICVVAQAMLDNPNGFADCAVQMVLVTRHKVPLTKKALALAHTDAFEVRAIAMAQKIEAAA